MEEQQAHLEAMDLKCPRKLDFNKPLLSTKRLNIVVSDRVQNTRDERVPFSWEKSAGTPKYVHHDEEETPRLRPPPCLWNQENKELSADLHEAYGDDDDDDLAAYDDDDDSDDNEKFNSDFLSDAMEVFSLSEALDIVQKTEKVRRKSRNEGLILKLAEDANNHNGNQSPNYLIKRFLPDATALAASSALEFSKPMMMMDNNKVCDSSSSAYLEASSYVASSPKGCGLEILFPWRLKHKLCAMKNPILPCSSSTTMQKQHEHKKHQKISSQAALYKM